MTFDFKKEYREFYLPPREPGIVEVPAANYLAVRGSGDPNEENGAYKAAIGMLYSVAFTLKMSGRSGHRIDGYFDYVVPPLEGFWWQEGVAGVDFSRKSDYQWISIIRLPDFISEDDFNWAVESAERKKKTDLSAVEFFRYNEGLCVQCMHLGPYDNEVATVAAMYEYAGSLGYCVDITAERYHHEIYLSDARRTAPEKLRTVIRHPIRAKAQ